MQMDKKVGDDLRSSKMESIFQASIDIFSEKGFEKATMDEIAARANVAKGTIYYHFKSKEELFLFLVEEGFSVLMNRVEQQLQTAGSAVDKLTVILEEQLRFFHSYRDFCVILLRESWGTANRQLEFRRKIGTYTRIIEQILKEGMERGELIEVDVQTTSSAIFGAISLAAYRYIMNQETFDPESLKNTLSVMLLDGLRVK
jgi:TetR/AcrR family transcriptional regulator